MTARQKAGVGFGVVVSIIALFLSVLGTLTGGAISFGGLKKQISETAKTAHDADSRSHKNEAALTGIHAKQEMMIDSLERIEDKIDGLK